MPRLIIRRSWVRIPEGPFVSATSHNDSGNFPSAPVTRTGPAGLRSPLFWGSLAFTLIVAGVAAFPVNWWLIARGRGHAVVHTFHH